MTRIELTLRPHSGSRQETIGLKALDIPTALTIADINVSEGEVELWRDGKRLGRLTKYKGRGGTFWQVQ